MPKLGRHYPRSRRGVGEEKTGQLWVYLFSQITRQWEEQQGPESQHCAPGKETALWLSQK